jgi:acyl dehydratase
VRQVEERPQAGAVLADVERYVLHEYWVRLFEDAMAERGLRADGEDLNPIFGYLMLLDVLDLPGFFASIRGTSVDEGLLNGEVEVARRGELGLRLGERYDVVVRLASVEAKRGRTLGDFELVTVEATISGCDSDCELVVRNRIVFARGGAEASPPPELSAARPSQLPPRTIESVTGEGAKLVVALTRDPSPLHWDEEMVRRLGLGDRPINPGSNSAAYVLQMVREWAGGYGRIRGLKVRFLRRVLVGDRVVGGGRVDGDGSQVAVWLDRVGAEGSEPVLEGTVELA